MSGYNTRVEYKGDAYNVQTQDKGLAVRYVESLIYKSGRLLATKRASYAAHMNLPDFAERIEQMMEDQHKTILGQIVEGRYD